MMKCSVFIATSVDGYIAKLDGSTDWLHSFDEAPEPIDMGWEGFIDSVDCVIMGRKCIESLMKMDTKPEFWIYGDRRVIVLSNTLSEVPEHMSGLIELYSGDLSALIRQLEKEGYQNAYIDGGVTIQSFLNLRLISDMSITHAPILLGAGIPLFGNTTQKVKLEHAQAKAFANNFIQVSYNVSYQ
ncbi:dihydrofolate reductase family protein [Vibrio rotiferianus]|uniref:dihydrofolate reductase family protein n=1 Tax=Vibrio rotiferianus TaxID=190895 RepID=UPI00289540E1|nr:Dihydrofolate reductase homolog [Vibrio rotiferianus]